MKKKHKDIAMKRAASLHFAWNEIEKLMEEMAATIL